MTNKEGCATKVPLSRRRAHRVAGTWVRTVQGIERPGGLKLAHGRRSPSPPPGTGTGLLRFPSQGKNNKLTPRLDA